ncbi:MAG: hypothetical protein RR857_23855 [Comamonas sp.]
MASKQLPRIGPFPFGVNNRLADHELTQSVGDGAVDLLRAAVNVDVTANGKLRRRAGFTLAHAGRAHSAWGNDKAGFYADGSDLYHLAVNGELQRTLIRSDLAPTHPVSYCEAGGTFYYSNGDVLGMVQGSTRVDFTPRPLLTPVLSATQGAMNAGRYQVCITQFGQAGESASTAPRTIDLPAGGGIRISDIPPAPFGCITLIYMTAPDGEVFGRVAVDIVGGVAEVVAPLPLGAGCQTLLLEPMPAGSIVRHSNGRLIVAVGNLLIYSEPFMPGLYRPSKNYIPFPARITLIEPCGRGIFVAADKTYWLGGEITGASLDEVLPYGALPHSGGNDPIKPDTCFWMSERGLVFGAKDGSVSNVQEDQLALSGGTAGATVFREHGGQKHVLAAVQDPSKTQASFGGRFDAEIIRKGVAQ